MKAGRFARLASKSLTDIAQDLQAPIRCFRLMAIESLLRNGTFEPGLREILEEHRRRETDSECLLLLDHALTLVTAENPEGLPDEIIAQGPESTAAWFAPLPAARKFQVLPHLAKAAFPISGRATELIFLQEPDELIQATLMQTCAPKWSEAALEKIHRGLASPRLSLRTAALAHLAAHHPDLLRRDLPGLLTNEDPRIRVIAMTGLIRIDPDEALRYLDELLHSREPQIINLALSNSIHFPYERVRPLLLQAIAFHRAPTIIRAIGMLLANNPDTETPFRLIDLAEGAEGERKAALKGALDSLVRNVKDADILDDGFATFRQELQRYADTRMLQRWLFHLADQLQLPNAPLADIEATVKRRGRHPRTAALMADLVPRLPQPSVRDRLLAWLQEAQGATTATIENNQLLSPIPDVATGDLDEQPGAPVTDNTPGSSSLPTVSEDRPAPETKSFPTDQAPPTGTTTPPATSPTEQAMPETGPFAAKQEHQPPPKPLAPAADETPPPLPEPTEFLTRPPAEQVRASMTKRDLPRTRS